LFGGAIAVYKNSASHRYVDWRDSLSVEGVPISGGDG
jgi:hypothetical protein